MTESENKISTQGGYDLWSTTYDQTQNPMLTLVDSFLSKVAPQHETPKIVELGCGTGRNFPHLLSFNPTELLGFDFSEGMLRQAQKKHSAPNIFLHQQDLDKPLPLESQSIDFVLISMTLEHLDNLSNVLSEAARILNDEGELVIVEIHPSILTPNTQAQFKSNEGTQKYVMSSYAHTEDEMRAHVEPQGLRLKEKIEIVPSEQDIQKNAKLEKYRGKKALLGLVFEQERNQS